MDKKTYALRYFGIELKESSLTDDEKILLMKIHESKRISKFQKVPEFEVDLEFSKLCSERLV